MHVQYVHVHYLVTACAESRWHLDISCHRKNESRSLNTLNRILERVLVGLLKCFGMRLLVQVIMI